MRSCTNERKVKMDQTIHQVLHFPEAMLLGHVASANFSNGNYNAALGQYLAIGDANAALQTFCGHLCPLYFGSPALIHQLKIQRAPLDTRQSELLHGGRRDERREAPPGFRQSGAREYVEHLLERLQLAAARSSVPLENGAQLPQIDVLIEALRVLDGCQMFVHGGHPPEAEESTKWLSAISSLIASADQAKPTQDSMKLVFLALTETLHQLKAQVSAISPPANKGQGPAAPPQMSFLSGGLQIHRCDDVGDYSDEQPHDDGIAMRS